MGGGAPGERQCCCVVFPPGLMLAANLLRSWGKSSLQCVVEDREGGHTDPSPGSSLPFLWVLGIGVPSGPGHPCPLPTHGSLGFTGAECSPDSGFLPRSL